MAAVKAESGANGTQESGCAVRGECVRNSASRHRVGIEMGEVMGRMKVLGELGVTRFNNSRLLSGLHAVVC